MVRLLVIAVLVAVPLLLGSCGAIGDLLAGPRPVPTATPTPLPTATPTPTPGPPATPAAAPAPRVGVTQQEAQAVVRAWFEAMGDEDYQRAEGLTTGEAARGTRQIAETIQREAGQRGVQADLVVRRLELGPAAEPPAGQAVRADFDIDVNAVAGPLSVRVQSFSGAGTFLVQQTPEGPRIAEIREVSGLPM